MKISNTTRAHIALFTANLLYGANYLIAKGLMPEKIGPSGFILVRVWGASLVFGTILLLRKEWITDKKDLLRILVCAVFGVMCNQLLFFNGLNMTSPGNASIIMTSTPILVLFLSNIILKTKLTIKKGLGVFLGALGAILLILKKDQGSTVISSQLGDLFVFLNALSYGLYLIFVKPLMKKYPPITIIAHVFLVGTLLVTPFGWHQFTEVEWSSFLTREWIALIYVVICVTIFAYLLNIFSLKHVQPTVTSSYIYLQPVLAIIFAYLTFYLGWGKNYTDLTWAKVLFAFMIFAGVYLTSQNSNPKKT